MIVLFSFPGDYNSMKLIEWLKSFNCKYERVDLQKEDFTNIKVTKFNKSS